MKEQERMQLQIEEVLHQLSLKTALSNLLMNYLVLLQKWNSAYNLTAVRELDLMIKKHLLDSLAILPWLKGEWVIDVGTGAGLPGIPLAVAKPEINFVLLDSNGKKTRFLKEVSRQLNLKNIEIVHLRVENYHPTRCFDTVISRAFSNLAQMIHWTQHLIGNKGVWLAMKGRYPTAELHEINKEYNVERYALSGLDGERCCVIIQNKLREKS